jgi:hypothetical protein
MSLLLTIDSSQTKQASDDFTIHYGDPITLGENYEIALLKAYLWYSYQNITSAFGNNKLTYYNGVSWVDIIYPNGIYSVQDINDYMQQQMLLNNDYDTGDNSFYVTIKANFQLLKVDLILSNGYKVDFTTSLLRDLLGFNSAIATTSLTAQNTADITRGVNSLNINCSLVNTGYLNEFQGSVIYSLSPEVAPGSLISLSPSPAIYLPINDTSIKNIRMYVTDNSGRKVNFNNESVNYVLHVRKSLR